MAKSKIIIIGGGASGLVAAITAARHGAKVTLLERKDRVGRKILATGNGRCNISNLTCCAENFHSNHRENDFYEKILSTFTIDQTVAFFKGIGIPIIEKEKGKLYPRSEQAASVVNGLLMEIKHLKIQLETNCQVDSIEKGKNFKVLAGNNTYYGNKIILATGGKSSSDLGSNGSGYLLAKALGHSINKPFPSIVQLKAEYPYLKHLKGTKIHGNVGLYRGAQLLREEYGEILFTDYGISGPPVLQVSRFGSKAVEEGVGVDVILDLVCDYTHEELDEILVQRFNDGPYKRLEDSFNGFIHHKLIIPLLKTNNIDINKKAANVTKEERIRLVNTLKGLKMPITGTRQWNQSQVTAGGISIKEINSETLESTIVPNVYICGEVMDVDGDCGGFNLQWAWSTGFIAGLHAAQKEIEHG